MSALSQRLVLPELLDELPADDPRAIHSRRDLQRLNSLMGHAGIMARQLVEVVNPAEPIRLIELGAGDGTFLLKVAQAFARQQRKMVPVEAWLVDQQPLLAPATEAALKQRGWHVRAVTADVFDWLGKRTGPPVNVLTANLFLHHFEGERLRTLLGLMAANADAIIACEPRRSSLALTAARLVPLIGCNGVTRHDAAISVRAGFAGTELSSQWPEAPAWSMKEEPAGLFSHLLVARRSRAS